MDAVSLRVSSSTSTRSAIEVMFGDRRAPDGTLVAENFARWFADSKIVDAAGAPLVLFHATTRDFTEFRPSISAFYGEGIYLLDDPGACYAYLDGSPGDLVMTVFAHLVNPYVFNAPPAEEEPSNFTLARALFKGPELRAALRELRGCNFENPRDMFRWKLEEMGHDGLIVKAHEEPVEYIVFDRCDVKSATGNSGLFREGCIGLTDHQPSRDDCERMRA